MAYGYKEAMYDLYVTSGGGDVCFQYGMWGHCGPECPEFGMRDGCHDLAEEIEKTEETNGY